MQGPWPLSLLRPRAGVPQNLAGEGGEARSASSQSPACPLSCPTRPASPRSPAWAGPGAVPPSFPLQGSPSRDSGVGAGVGGGPREGQPWFLPRGRKSGGLGAWEGLRLGGNGTEGREVGESSGASTVSPGSRVPSVRGVSGASGRGPQRERCHPHGILRGPRADPGARIGSRLVRGAGRL